MCNQDNCLLNRFHFYYYRWSMQQLLFFLFVVDYLLLVATIKGNDEYGLYFYSFDNDTLTTNCTKPKPLIFQLMFDFLSMIKEESSKVTQQCVLNGEGPGFLSPPSIARNIFAVMTIAYNTHARYTQHAKPATMYDGWARMPPTKTDQKVPDCIYIYGFYHIAKYLMPERLASYPFKEKYETYNCNLTQVSANTTSDLGLVQRDVDELKLQLKTDGFNQEGCFADATNFK